MPSTCPCWSSAWAQVRRRTCSCHLQAWPGAVHGPARSNHRARFTVLRSADRYPFLPACPAVEAGVRGPSQQVVQAYLGFKMGVWSYNGAVKHWEPVVEPWDVIAQCAANYGSRVGVPSGAWYPPLCVGGGCLYVWCSRGSMVRLRGTGRPLVMAAP
jgi:hypothetical protein